MISDNEILSARILIVDDNQNNITMLKEMLATAGYTNVLGITDSRETLELYKGFNPNLVLLDINMPHLDGYRIMEELKAVEKGNPVPILVLTALQDKETCIKSLKSAARDFLAKPFDYTEVITRIRNMLEVSLLYNRDRKQNVLLGAIFESIKDSIITVDRELVVLEYNKSAEFICGLPGNNEAKGESYESFINNCSGGCLDALTETFKTKQPAERSRFECNNRFKQRRVVSVATYPLLDQQEELNGCVITVRDETQLADLETNLHERQQLQNIVGSSEKMQKIYNFIETLSHTQTTVLITGENGTGKSLVAEALHYSGKDNKTPFVLVNCAALSDNLLESELFGHVKGAFTGAISDRVGRFQKADGGTVFLDEIGNISSTMQLRLLRILEEMEFERVGESTPIKINVRIIAATNQDLRKKVKSGNFREDLYHRLKVVEITMPPLRERSEDIPLLVGHFIKKLNKKLNKDTKSISTDVQKIFMNYKWPGNVRELYHTLEYALSLYSKPIITIDNLPPDFQVVSDDKVGFKENKKQKDRCAVVQALEKAGWNKAKAARLLGIDRRTIYLKIEKYNITEKRPID